MTTSADGGEVQPAEFVTVQVYVPAVSPEIVVPVPVPVEVVPPGVFVKVQDPVEGKPFKITLPEETVHEGCVIVPIVGADGGDGCVLIIILAEAVEIHPDELVTV